MKIDFSGGTWNELDDLLNDSFFMAVKWNSGNAYFKRWGEKTWIVIR